MRYFAFIILASVSGLVPIEASDEFTGPWRGSEREILAKALDPLTSVAAARIKSRFQSPAGEISLERKLWLIVDFLVADEGRNYGASYCEKLFSTIGSKTVASSYSAEKASSLSTILFESVEALNAPGPGDPSERIFTVGGPFGDEMISTTQAALDHERRIESACAILRGCLNVLLNHDKKGGLRLARKLAASRHDDVALVGRAFIAVSDIPASGEPAADDQKPVRAESKAE